MARSLGFGQQGKWPYFWLALWTILVALNISPLRYLQGDEVGYLDPAINLCEGRGFVSTAWWQPADQFFACNLPLYPAVSFIWFKIFGADLPQGRLLSLTLFALSTVIILQTLRRAMVFRSSRQEILFLLLWLLGLYSGSISQFARPEALCLFFLSTYMFSWTVSSPSLSALALMLTGIGASLSGLQLVTVLGFYSLLAFGLDPRKALRQTLFLVLGGITGAAIAAALYASQGVLGVFISSTFGLGPNRAQWQGFRDPALWCTTLLGFALWIRFRKLLPSPIGRVLLLGSLGGILVAGGLYGLSKFPQYYCFFALLPPIIGISATLPLLWPAISNLTRTISVLAVLASITGFPLYLAYYWNTKDQRNLALVEQYCRDQVTPGSIIFCDPAAYFSVRRIAAKTYTQFYLDHANADERASISKVILLSKNAPPYIDQPTVFSQLGGDWQESGRLDSEAAAPLRIRTLSFLNRLSYLQPYNFTAWDIQHHR